MTIPSTSPRIRLTITVTPEVHEVFRQLAEASRMSIGRSMGDWLEDTVDAAEYTSQLVQRARAAPGQVSREVHALALGLADETGMVMKRIQEQGRAARTGRGAPAGSPEPSTPRLVIRGVKSPGKTRSQPGTKRAKS